MNTANSSKRKTVLAGLVGLFAAGGMTQAVAQGGEAATSQSAIDEIIVTANKREQSIHDVPMSISAIGNNEINRKGLVSMEDYLASIPGVSMIDRGVGRNAIIIRGVSADPTFGDPTTGVYFGDTPVTGLSFLGGSSDIKLVDMERVEILRGPQGTLYGASSLAGTVRNIPKLPDLDHVGGRLKVGVSSMAKEGGDGNDVVGTINLPLIEGTLALRASAYRFSNSGYIKNVAGNDPTKQAVATDFGVPELAINEGDVGASDYTGGRLALRWEPVDALDLTLTYLTQDLEQDGIPEVELQFGEYEQARLQLGDFVPSGGEGLIDNIDMTNLVIDYDFGWAKLTSSSSWFEESSARYTDASMFFLFPTSQRPERDVDVFVEEVRFVSQLEGPVQFVAGLYYEDIENIFDVENSYAGIPSLNPTSEIGVFNFVTSSFTEQKAIFGELSYQFSDALALTLGGRFFDYDKNESTVSTGPFNGVAPGESITVSSKTSETGNNGKINLSYTPGEDLLVYAQWSEGFRLGRPQLSLPASVCDVDGNGQVDGTNLPIGNTGTEPDTLESFEIGGKITAIDGRLNIAGSIYHNNWNGIPVTVIGSPATCALLANAGEAETQGIEFDVSYNVAQDLRLDFSASYSDAELTEDIPSLNAVSGDRLPGSPRFNANLALEYDFLLAGHESFIRADYALIGGFYPDLQESTQEAGDYGLINLKVGAKVEDFILEIYAKNLTNEDKLSYWNPVFNAGNRLRPRTIGVSVGYNF